MPRLRIALNCLLLLLFGAAGCSEDGSAETDARSTQASAKPLDTSGPPELGGVPPMPEPAIRGELPGVRVEAVARDLEVPWDIAFAPDGRMFFTERPGRLRVMRSGEAPRLYATLDQVAHRGEGGLMGLALHPRYAEEPFIYLMYTTRGQSGVINRVSRFTDSGSGLEDEKTLIDDIPGADLESLCGKILRITPEGGVPEDNPFPKSPVWAYGFRNVSALTWSPDNGQLWAANHGPSGEFSGLKAKDSVYVARKGGNHGWPLILGTAPRSDIVSPILYYPDDAVPPGGSLFYTGQLFPNFRGDYFLATLRSTHLQRVVPSDDGIEAIERWFPEKYGRLRALAQGPDGAIYVSTSNRDGRARRSYPGSDFIYRLVPAKGADGG